VLQKSTKFQSSGEAGGLFLDTHKYLSVKGPFAKIHWHNSLALTSMNSLCKYRRKWLLHLQKIPPYRISLKSYHYRPQGRRAIGRPKKRWREQL